MICANVDENGFLYVIEDSDNCPYISLFTNNDKFSDLLLLDSQDILISFSFGFSAILLFWSIGFVVSTTKKSIRLV